MTDTGLNKSSKSLWNSTNFVYISILNMEPIKLNVLKCIKCISSVKLKDASGTS